MRVAYNRASLPFSLNQTGTLLNRYLAQFVSAIDTPTVDIFLAALVMNVLRPE